MLAMWFDSTIFPINKVFEEGDTVVLDTLQFDLGALLVENINNPQSIYELSHFLTKRPEWLVQIFVLTNTNYDTTSNHFLRTQAKDLQKSLIYFNVDPARFQIKDSVVIAFDKQFGKNKAYRKIVVVFKGQTDFGLLWKDLNEAYQSKKKIRLQTFFDEMVVEKATVPIIPTELKNHQITKLIDQFYHQFYEVNPSANFKILPYKYEIEIGDISKVVIPDEYIEEWETVIKGATIVLSIPDQFYEVVYQPPIPTQKVIYLKENYRGALVNFLQYNFSYELDEMTNIPSNIEPIHSTKEKLEALEKYIKPNYDYEVKGRCNAYTFWNFHWGFQDENTPILISISEIDKTAFIEFKDEQRVIKYAKYEFQNEKWSFIEVFDIGENPPTSFWKYLIVGILGLFMVTSLIIKFILVLNDRKK